MRKLLVIIAVFGLLPMLLSAQPDNKNEGEKLVSPQNEMFGVPQEIQIKVNSFFKLVFEKNYEEAYKVILENSPLNEKSESVEELIKETKKINKFYGTLRGYEFVSTEAASKSYVRVRCLGICEDFPMRWVFTYYKSPKYGWIITNIKFDDLSEYFFTD